MTFPQLPSLVSEGCRESIHPLVSPRYLWVQPTAQGQGVMVFVSWVSPDPPLASSHGILGCRNIPAISPAASLFISVWSLGPREPRRLQVSIAGSPAALCSLAGSGTGPSPPPLVLVSSFPSVALPALPHNLCVYVFVQAARWGLLAGSAEAKGCRVWGGWILFRVRAFGRLSNLPRLTHPNTHTAFAGASKVSSWGRRFEEFPGFSFFLSLEAQGPGLFWGRQKALGEGARRVTTPTPLPGVRHSENIYFRFWCQIQGVMALNPSSVSSRKCLALSQPQSLTQ